MSRNGLNFIKITLNVYIMTQAGNYKKVKKKQHREIGCEAG